MESSHDALVLLFSLIIAILGVLAGRYLSKLWRRIVFIIGILVMAGGLIGSHFNKDHTEIWGPVILYGFALFGGVPFGYVKRRER